jgi:hypothetical protein
MRITLEYDTEFAPLSHDIITSLAILRAYALRHSSSAGINVIVKGSGGRSVGVEKHYDEKYRQKKTVDVLIGVLANCRWVESFAFLDKDSDLGVTCGPTVVPTSEQKSNRRPEVPEWAITPYSQKQLETLAEGESLFLQDGFVPSDASLQYATQVLPSDSIVIHPRSSTFSLERNTPIALFGELIQRLGPSKVFMIPDSEGLGSQQAWRALGATPVPEAASSLDLRIALATVCKLNVIWGAGNTYPLHFSPAKFILFGALNSTSTITTEEYYRRKGPSPYRNPPWLGPGQSYDWTDAVTLTSSYVAGEVLSRLKNPT